MESPLRQLTHLSDKFERKTGSGMDFIFPFVYNIAINKFITVALCAAEKKKREVNLKWLI